MEKCDQYQHPHPPYSLLCVVHRTLLTAEHQANMGNRVWQGEAETGTGETEELQPSLAGGWGWLWSRVLWLSKQNPAVIWAS